eukprot:7262259-Prymnesium_polylepis.2
MAQMICIGSVVVHSPRPMSKRCCSSLRCDSWSAPFYCIVFCGLVTILVAISCRTRIAENLDFCRLHVCGGSSARTRTGRKTARDEPCTVRGFGGPFRTSSFSGTYPGGRHTCRVIWTGRGSAVLLRVHPRQ